MKPALVTGASGFLGWHVVQVLRQHAIPVRALVRNPDAAKNLDAELVQGDLRDASSVGRAAAGAQLDRDTGLPRVPSDLRDAGWREGGLR